MEFLVAIEFTVPPGTSNEEVLDRRAREAVRARELSAAGHIRRLWRIVDEESVWANVGIWDAADEDELVAVLKSLPLYSWATASISALGHHANDPGWPSSA